MIVLSSLLNEITFSPRIELSSRVDKKIRIQLKSRTTSQTKIFFAAAFDEGDEPRAIVVDFYINQYPEDLDAGRIDLKKPDFPAGYYSYLLYETDREGENAILLDVGVAYLERGETEFGHVAFESDSATLEYKSYEK